MARRREDIETALGSFPVVIDDDIPKGCFEIHGEHQIVRVDTETGEHEVLWDDREESHDGDE